MNRYIFLLKQDMVRGSLAMCKLYASLNHIVIYMKGAQRLGMGLKSSGVRACLGNR
jgi:hypothetical protein